MSPKEIKALISRAVNFIIGVRSYPNVRDPFGSHCFNCASEIIEQIASIGLVDTAADLFAQLEEAR